MPTYDYFCNDCNNKFEYFQKMTDSPLEVCPECGGHVKRLIGAGLRPIFKGSGFYETDYKNKKNSTTKETKSLNHNKTETESAKKTPDTTKEVKKSA